MGKQPVDAGHPTSYSRTTSLPSTCAVSAASSATGMSLVPPVAMTTFPMPSGWGSPPTMPTGRPYGSPVPVCCRHRPPPRGHSGDEDAVLTVGAHGVDDAADLLRGLPRTVDHLCRALPHLPVQIDLRVADVLEGAFFSSSMASSTLVFLAWTDSSSFRISEFICAPPDSAERCHNLCGVRSRSSPVFQKQGADRPPAAPVSRYCPPCGRGKSGTQSEEEILPLFPSASAFAA